MVFHIDEDLKLQAQDLIGFQQSGLKILNSQILFTMRIYL